MAAWDVAQGAWSGFTPDWWLRPLGGLLALAAALLLAAVAAWIETHGGPVRRLGAWLLVPSLVLGLAAVAWLLLVVVAPLVLLVFLSLFVLAVNPGGPLAGIFLAGAAALVVGTPVVTAWIVNR